MIRYHVDTELQATVHTVLVAAGAGGGAACPPVPLVGKVEAALRRRNLFNGKLAEQISKLKKSPEEGTAGDRHPSQSPPLRPTHLSRQMSEAPHASSPDPTTVREQLNTAILTSLRAFASALEGGPSSPSPSPSKSPSSSSPRPRPLPGGPSRSLRHRSLLLCVLDTLAHHPAHFTGGEAVTDGLGELLQQDLRSCFVHPLRVDPKDSCGALVSGLGAAGGEGAASTGFAETHWELEVLLDAAKWSRLREDGERVASPRGAAEHALAAAARVLDRRGSVSSRGVPESSRGGNPGPAAAQPVTPCRHGSLRLVLPDPDPEPELLGLDSALLVAPFRGTSEPASPPTAAANGAPEELGTTLSFEGGTSAATRPPAHSFLKLDDFWQNASATGSSAVHGSPDAALYRAGEAMAPGFSAVRPTRIQASTSGGRSTKELHVEVPQDGGLLNGNPHAATTAADSVIRFLRVAAPDPDPDPEGRDVPQGGRPIAARGSAWAHERVSEGSVGTMAAATAAWLHGSPRQAVGQRVLPAAEKPASGTAVGSTSATVSGFLHGGRGRAGAAQPRPVATPPRNHLGGSSDSKALKGYLHGGGSDDDDNGGTESCGRSSAPHVPSLVSGKETVAEMLLASPRSRSLPRHQADARKAAPEHQAVGRAVRSGQAEDPKPRHGLPKSTQFSTSNPLFARDARS